ncbi:hypothetical protein [Paenibacillus tarimensis]|uniref:hypothetical protein n=1 Tax=Paenibacillus tarimensis TaxID=416012 RepID=UPI001F31D429|nr:hypothetical protein [Paenibacillus tarimensis]MCF2946441.1 hypothetical protein [Paenibacillus tarimensis]
MSGKETNPEIRDLATHQAGAIRSHETRYTKQPVTIEPGRAPSRMNGQRDGKN